MEKIHNVEEGVANTETTYPEYPWTEQCYEPVNDTLQDDQSSFPPSPTSTDTQLPEAQMKQEQLQPTQDNLCKRSLHFCRNMSATEFADLNAMEKL